MNSRIRVINETVRYIEDHLDQKMKLTDVANALYYSPYYLHRTFSKLTGITIHNYIQRRKLTEAGKRLVCTKEPIIDVAYLAGYETQQAFTTIFREMYKSAPNQYREKQHYYPLQLKFLFEGQCFRASRQDIERTAQIRLAEKEDTAAWMRLVRLVIDGFPNLDEEVYLGVLQQYIRQRRALIMQDKRQIIGIMMLDYNRRHIDFLGIHPFYRSTDAGRIFIEYACKGLFKSRQISITTYREGDKADTGYLRELKTIGFREAELLVEMEYPTQRMIAEFM